MRAIVRRRLGDERGQTLVFFVVSLTALVALLGFVLNVGAWVATSHKLQNAADAAALAAVQSGTTTSVDDGWADLSGAPPAGSPPPNSVTITATHEAPLFGAGLFGIGTFNQTATATAQAIAPATLPNPPFNNSAYITPIVVNACIFTGSCPGGQLVSNCYSPPAGCRLNLDTDDRIGSLFGIAQISSSATIRRNTFRRWMQCNSCAPGPIDGQSSAPVLTVGTSGNQALNGMNSTVGKTLILPVFDSFDGTSGTYNIVGFSAFVVDNNQLFDGATNWQQQPAGATCKPNCKLIDGYFLTNYTLPTRFVTNGGSASQDFGVRAIGLTS
jgi:hypothetical protein